MAVYGPESPAKDFAPGWGAHRLNWRRANRQVETVGREAHRTADREVGATYLKSALPN